MGSGLAPLTYEGRTVGRYRLDKVIGQGGMATVYRAVLQGPRGMEKAVAVKVVHSHLASEERFVNMFLDEMRLAALIEHPNVCGVIDFGQDHTVPYLVMDLLDGLSLLTVARAVSPRGGVPGPIAARILCDAARGLHAAHEAKDADGVALNLVHRDVSKHNLMVLRSGVTVVVDFGIAQATGRLTQTRTGHTKGKTAYMAPEQVLAAKDLDRRVDVWGLGVVLWEITTARRLFRAEDNAETAHKVLMADIPDPRDVVEDYPDELAQIVMSALSRERDLRTPSARVFADQIERWLYSLGRPMGPRQVAEWLAEVAPETAVSAAPTPDAPLTSSDIVTRAPATEATHSVRPPRAEPDPAETKTERARPSRLAWVLGLGALLGAGALGLLFLGGVFEPEPRTEPSAPPTRAEPPSGPMVTADAQDDEPSTEGTPGEAEIPEPAPTAAEPSEEPAAAEPAAEEPSEEPAAEEPASRPRTRAARRAPAEPGRLGLFSVPLANVRWRGRSLGRTPLIDVEMPPGRHRLELTPVGGGPTRIATVRIRSGQATGTTLRLADLPER